MKYLYTLLFALSIVLINPWGESRGDIWTAAGSDIAQERPEPRAVDRARERETHWQAVQGARPLAERGSGAAGPGT